jgi:hypothetical protein
VRVTGEDAAHRRRAQFLRRVESTRELRIREERPGYGAAAYAVEVVLVGRPECDWTASERAYLERRWRAGAPPLHVDAHAAWIQTGPRGQTPPILAYLCPFPRD